MLTWTLSFFTVRLSASPTASKPAAPTTPPVSAPECGTSLMEVMATPAPGASPAAEGLGTEESGGGKQVQRNRGRCWTCKKKVGLTGFECQCSYVFCGKVRGDLPVKQARVVLFVLPWHAWRCTHDVVLVVYARPQHRYADEHACDFDYKTMERGLFGRSKSARRQIQS